MGLSTTVETHKAQKRGQGVKKGEKGKGGPKRLREERNGSNHMKGKEGDRRVRDTKVALSKGAQYHNPDAMARLIGPRNIAKVEINGIMTRGLMDSGSQVNMMTDRFLKKLGLIMRPLTDLGLHLGVEGSAGTDIPYLGYTEANLKLSAANNYDSDQLFLVVEQHTKFGD